MTGLAEQLVRLLSAIFIQKSGASPAGNAGFKLCRTRRRRL